MILFTSRCSKLLFGTAVLQFLAITCSALKYNDHVSSEVLANMFNDDECIDGTLSMLDLGPEVSENTVIEYSTNDENPTNDFGGKTPMSLLHELATLNNIKYQYELTDEVGPAHGKKFVIALKLGEENYVADGKSIKKAQHEAARLALNSTLYLHPPVKNTLYTKPASIQETPVEKLNKWAKKHSNSYIKYSFIEQTRLHNDYNQYHRGMYSKAQNVHKVSVKVLNREFTGEGFSSDAAKQNAANNALNTLQETQAFCMFDDGIKQLFNRMFTDSMDSISLVHQFGSKSNLETSFELVSEEGPPHTKKFEYKCKVGHQFETFGEGSSKKEAKQYAAESMIRLLKSSIPYDNQCINIEKKKSKKRKPKNLVKSDVRTYEDDDKYLPQDLNFSFIKEEINPISKLHQLQQLKHDIEPTFVLVEEKGHPNKEFVMEVRIGELTFTGSGLSKKIAKKKAAEGMLEKLGYSSKSNSNRNINNHNKKKEFQIHNKPNKKHILPGVDINSEKFEKLDRSVAMPIESATDQEGSGGRYLSDDEKVKVKYHHDGSNQQETQKKAGEVKKDANVMDSGTDAKRDLKKMADQLGIRYQFSDFPKSGNKGFVSLISLTTTPPKICYGEGLNTDTSQDKAALKALSLLYKSQLSGISKMLMNDQEMESSKNSVKQGFYMIDKETVINAAIPHETE